MWLGLFPGVVYGVVVVVLDVVDYFSVSFSNQWNGCVCPPPSAAPTPNRFCRLEEPYILQNMGKYGETRSQEWYFGGNKVSPG